MTRHPYGDLMRQNYSVDEIVNALKSWLGDDMRLTRMMWFNTALARAHCDPKNLPSEEARLTDAYKGEP